MSILKLFNYDANITLNQVKPYTRAIYEVLGEKVPVSSLEKTNCMVVTDGPLLQERLYGDLQSIGKDLHIETEMADITLIGPILEEETGGEQTPETAIGREKAVFNLISKGIYTLTVLPKIGNYHTTLRGTQGKEICPDAEDGAIKLKDTNIDILKSKLQDELLYILGNYKGASVSVLTLTGGHWTTEKLVINNDRDIHCRIYNSLGFTTRSRLIDIRDGFLDESSVDVQMQRGKNCCLHSIFNAIAEDTDVGHQPQLQKTYFRERVVCQLAIDYLNARDTKEKDVIRSILSNEESYISGSVKQNTIFGIVSAVLQSESTTQLKIAQIQNISNYLMDCQTKGEVTRAELELVVRQTQIPEKFVESRKADAEQDSFGNVDIDSVISPATDWNDTLSSNFDVDESIGSIYCTAQDVDSDFDDEYLFDESHQYSTYQTEELPQEAVEIEEISKTREKSEEHTGDLPAVSAPSTAEKMSPPIETEIESKLDAEKSAIKKLREETIQWIDASRQGLMFKTVDNKPVGRDEKIENIDVSAKLTKTTAALLQLSPIQPRQIDRKPLRTSGSKKC